MQRFGLFAKKCRINNMTGYKVIKYLNGKDIASQFVPEEDYEKFCQGVGWEPVLLDEENEK